MHFLPITLLALTGTIHQAAAATASFNVTSFDQCPKLAPRAKAPTNVRDLRHDDIKVVMALGDSITAGFSAKPKPFLDIKRIFEFRGVSYAAGGDPGAITLPNGFRNYQPKLAGASVGEHLVEFCFGPLCPPFQYRPQLDRFNAAQSGGMAQNLKKEAYYLLDQLHADPNVDIKNDWKFLNIQIGSNDLCLACTPFAGDRNMLSPDAYEANIREALQIIRTNVPRVFVNLLGNFRVSDIYAHGQNLPRWVQLECACALAPGPLGDKMRNDMDNMMTQYNERLKRIHDDYERINDPQFGISLQLFDTKLTTFPDDTFSNFDCFHPTEKTHAYLAKFAWNGLALSLADRPSMASYIPDLKINCPTSNDRLRTK
ncbi:GDSL-like Lipase/Acylhydrolase-domain-containing protein [Syncephalis fuscata]|nr:GDSL-like Lipase/Acylhydrolase-domain-containing protein [Syncephalis fuscata]